METEETETKVEIHLNASDTQLSLGIPVFRRRSEDDGEFAWTRARNFGTSMLSWRESPRDARKKLIARVPDFFFKFYIAIDQPFDEDDIDGLHGALLYKYMCALDCGKYKDFLASNKYALLTDLRKTPIRTLNTHADIEQMLAEVFFRDYEAMSAESFRAYKVSRYEKEVAAGTLPEWKKRPMENELRLFSIRHVTDRPSTSPAFASIFEIGCLNHCMAVTLYAALLPHINIPKIAKFDYGNPPLERPFFGQLLFIHNNKTQAHLVEYFPSGWKTVFRYDKTAEECALSKIVSQLGTAKPLMQTRLISEKPIALLGNERMLLVAQGSPFHTGPFFSVKSLPAASSLVHTRIAFFNSGEMNYNCEVLPVTDIDYCGILGVDCSLKECFSLQPPQPKRVAGSLTAMERLKSLKRKREEMEADPEEAHEDEEAKEFALALQSLSAAEDMITPAVEEIFEEHPEYLNVIMRRRDFYCLSFELLQRCAHLPIVKAWCTLYDTELCDNLRRLTLVTAK